MEYKKFINKLLNITKGINDQDKYETVQTNPVVIHNKGDTYKVNDVYECGCCIYVDVEKETEDKTAEQMFNELGYILVRKNEHTVSYQHKELESLGIIISVLNNKISKYLNDYREVMTFKEIKAINKQIEELGW